MIYKKEMSLCVTCWDIYKNDPNITKIKYDGDCFTHISCDNCGERVTNFYFVRCSVESDNLEYFSRMKKQESILVNRESEVDNIKSQIKSIVAEFVDMFSGDIREEAVSLLLSELLNISGDEIRCPDCDGQGIFGYGSMVEHNCEKCNGEGIISLSK